MRTLVIGDIHGGLIALEECLEKSQYDKEYDKLIFLGDYVDGWSESAELIEFLIDLDKQCINKPIFLKGNHDFWFSEWLLKGKANNIWLAHGGQQTINSYIRTGLIVENSHKKFFKELLNYYLDDQNRAFIHGGFTSRKGVGHEPYQATYYWDRDLWELAVLVDFNKNAQVSKKATRFYKHKEVFIGHTATTNYTEECGNPITVPMNKCNVWNVDTGAGFSGKLTIMDIDTKEFWQSDYVKNLYPDEKGRI